MKRSKWKTELKVVPDKVQVKDGSHKGMVGEVWYANDDRAQIETSNGWYIAENLRNLIVISTKKERRIVA